MKKHVLNLMEELNWLHATIIFLFLKLPTNAKLIDKLSHSSYMFRHYRVIVRELVVSTLPCYTIMSNAVAGNTYLLHGAESFLRS